MPFQLPMPCKNISACFPCNDLPTTNRSAEGQDVIEDFAIEWGNLQTNTPPLGSLFTANGCGVVCASTKSAEDAFLCAQRSQALCVVNNWQPPPTDPPPCLNFPCAPTVPPEPPHTETFGNDPEACSTLCPDGTPFTFAVPAGSFISTNRVLANRMASSFACRQATIHKLCMILVPEFVCIDNASTLTFIASGRSVDATSNFWEFRGGTLPTGFSFTNTTAGPAFTLNGTPTALGDFTFSVRVTAPNGDFSEHTFTVSVVGITTPDPLPDAQLGVAYSQTLAASGIAGTLIWLVTAGALPDGLTLDEDTGEISGTPTLGGDFTFTVLASSSTAGCSKQFTITVAGCFIDASTNADLTVFFQTISRNGGLAIFTDGNTNDGWYYLNHIFQIGPVVGGSGFFVCASDRYIGATDSLSNNLFIDLQLGTIQNLAHAAVNPQYMNNNGDMALQGGGQSFIYTAATNSLTANLAPFTIYQINDSRVAIGTQLVGPDVHAFLRSATGILTDLHPAVGVGTVSNPAGFAGQVQPGINSSGHVAGVWGNGGGLVRVFGNFGGASVFLSALIANVNKVILNDSDQVAWDNPSTGHVFIWNGAALDIGNLGVLQGFNNSGTAVGQDFANTAAWIYANGVVSPLISKIPSAAGDGWTSIIFVYDISNDNFVTGFGVKNGVVTLFVAKVCI